MIYEAKSFHLQLLVSSIQADESTLLEDKKWLQNPSHTSWTVFHAKSREHPVCNDISGMLSILRDNFKYPATIKHLINLLIQAVEFLNPDKQQLLALTSLCTH